MSQITRSTFKSSPTLIWEENREPQLKYYFTQKQVKKVQEEPVVVKRTVSEEDAPYSPKMKITRTNSKAQIKAKSPQQSPSKHPKQLLSSVFTMNPKEVFLPLSQQLIKRQSTDPSKSKKQNFQPYTDYDTYASFLESHRLMAVEDRLSPLLVSFFSHEKPESAEFNDYEFLLNESWKPSETKKDVFIGDLKVLVIHFNTFQYEIIHKVVETVPKSNSS